VSLRKLVVFLVLLLSSSPGLTQDSGDDRPFVRVQIQSETVTVGQPVTVFVEILAPNWFTKAPEFPDINIDDALTMPPGRSMNFTERIKGTTYAGQRREYIVYPLTPGTFDISPIQVVVSYAIDPPNSSLPTTVSSRPLQFEAVVPEEAAGLDYFIATNQFTLEQTVSQKLDSLKVGDSFTRTITMTAPGVVAMVFPPPRFESIDGLGIYSEQPVVEDKGGERGESRRGTRVDSVTYFMEQEGKYLLPEISVYWWDIGSEKLRKETIPTIELVVLPNTEIEAEQLVILTEEDQAPPEGDSGLTMIVKVAIGIFAVAMLFLLSQLWRKKRERLHSWLENRKAEKARTEKAFFNRFRQACDSGDPKVIFNRLMSWLDRVYSGPGSATLDQYVILANDPDLTEQVRALKSILYGRGKDGELGKQWSPSHFLRRVAMSRKQFLRDRNRLRSRSVELPSLNPGR
jgi:hypothetical protein